MGMHPVTDGKFTGFQQNLVKQEYIPIGCIPSAAVAVGGVCLGGVSAWWGSAWGVSTQGGVCSGEEGC